MNNEAIQPRAPRIPPLAEELLTDLSRAGHGRRFSLGGASSLANYHEYQTTKRTTKDINAWWIAQVGREDREEVFSKARSFLENCGEVRLRR